MDISVFGMGKLGACLVASLANAGHTVTGFDPSADAVKAINSASPLVFEPGLAEILARNISRIRGLTSADEALAESEAAFVIVPTPSSDHGDFKNDYVLKALEAIGENLRANPRPFTVVISSTVMPGSCDSEFVPLLERVSGLKVGDNLGLAYSPEFIALGSILQDMQFPDLILIGESDSAAGDVVQQIALSMVKNSPSVQRMSLASAEVTKIAINTFVTTKISFANMLGEICDQIPGTDIDNVTSAVGSDRRVGSSYLKAALGYGGPCFPRDNAALAFAAESRGVGADIARATDSINRRQVDRIVDIVLKNSKLKDTVGVVGLAYKPNTPVTDSSEALEIAHQLSQSGRHVIGFDPLVAAAKTATTAKNLVVTDDSGLLSAASVIVLANPELDFRSQGNIPPSRIIIDLWGAEATEEATAIRPGRRQLGGAV